MPRAVPVSPNRFPSRYSKPAAPDHDAAAFLCALVAGCCGSDPPACRAAPHTGRRLRNAAAILAGHCHQPLTSRSRALRGNHLYRSTAEQPGLPQSPVPCAHFSQAPAVPTGCTPGRVPATACCLGVALGPASSPPTHGHEFSPARSGPPHTQSLCTDRSESRIVPGISAPGYGP